MRFIRQLLRPQPSLRSERWVAWFTDCAVMDIRAAGRWRERRRRRARIMNRLLRAFGRKHWEA